MSRKQIIVVVILVLITSSLSALVAYRRGLRRTRSSIQYSWSQSGAGGCVDFHDVSSHTGETGCVSGRILRVFTSRAGNSFLDFCADHRTCPFTTVIFASDRSKFGDLETLAGRQVEIQGPITTYQGRAEIIVHDPQQIRVLP